MIEGLLIEQFSDWGGGSHAMELACCPPEFYFAETST